MKTYPMIEIPYIEMAYKDKQVILRRPFGSDRVERLTTDKLVGNIRIRIWTYE